MALFRVDFSGRGELGERQQKVSQSNVSRVVLTSSLAGPGLRIGNPSKPKTHHLCPDAFKAD